MGPLMPRKGLGRSARPPGDDGVARARAMAGIWVAGAALMLATFPLPHHDGFDPRLEGLLAVAASLGAGVMLFVGDLSRRVFELFLVIGLLIVTGTVAFGGGDGMAYASYYLWLTVQAFYFLPLRRAAWHLVGVAVAYAVGLTLCSSTTVTSTAYVLLVGTALATGAFVAFVRLRIDGLVAELSEMARCDPLTGLLNRRGFMPVLEAQVGLGVRNGDPLSVLVLDLDRFKALNDAEGHAAGDAALADAAAALRGECRRSDVAARLGGEEFALLLPGTDAIGAVQAAGRVRAALAVARPGLTASVGVATTPIHATDADGLLRAADRAMYSAKDAGRDCVRVAGGPGSAVGAPLS